MLNVSIIPPSGTAMNFDDSSIVANSVSVTMSTCRPKNYDIGTFNSALLKMSVIDDDALQHEFSGLPVTLQETNDQNQVTYLGTYYIDGASVKRERNTVTFSAHDRAVKFDIGIADNARSTTYTAFTAIQAACTAAGNTELYNVSLSDFPNYDVTFNLSNAALQTWRDVVMWCCQLCAANAIIDRLGKLKIIHARNTSSTEDFVITGAERSDIEFSDARIYAKYMTAYSGKKVKTYISTWNPPDAQAKAGTIALDNNPLLDGKSETDCDNINTAILTDIRTFLQRQITAKLFQNSQIGLGNSVRFSGGKVDVRRSVLGVATYIVWRYHGPTTLTCTAPEMAEEG